MPNEGYQTKRSKRKTPNAKVPVTTFTLLHFITGINSLYQDHMIGLTDHMAMHPIAVNNKADQTQYRSKAIPAINGACLNNA